MSDEHFIDLVDNEWRNEKLPNEDIQLPMNKLPDPEENENQASLKEQARNLIKTLSVMCLNCANIIVISIGRQVVGHCYYGSSYRRAVKHQQPVNSFSSVDNELKMK